MRTGWRRAAWTAALTGLMVLAISAAPVRSERSSVDLAIDAARTALSRGDGIDGEMKLRAALAQGASRGEVAAWMGLAYLEQEDRDKARAWLGPGKFSPATAAQGWRALGQLELLDDNLAAAGRAYDKALGLMPNDPSLWVEIGRLRYAGGEHVLALDAARRALDIDPADVRALEFQAQLVRDRYGLVAALPWFERALIHGPDDVRVLVGYAATLGELGRASEAVTVTRKVLQLKPGNAQAFYLQAVLAARAGDYALSRSLLGRTKGKLDSYPGVQTLRGVVELAAGNTGAAAEALEDVLRVMPDNRHAKDLLSAAIFKSGHYRYVTLRFAREVAQDDASPYLLTVTARSYEALGDRMKAGELLDRAARLPEARLAIRADTGDVGALLAQGSGSAAQARAEAASTANPGSYYAQAVAGDVELALGDGPGAQQHYAAAARIRMPTSLFARRFEAYAIARDPVGAAYLVTGYLRQNPTNRTAMRAGAGLAIASGELPRARAMLAWLRDTGDGSDVKLLCDLAMVQAGQGDLAAARGTARTAYRLQRASPMATQALGYVYAADGAFAVQARALLDKAQAMVGSTPLILQARQMLAARRAS
jgi:Tfp pilus assembly protein PilF